MNTNELLALFSAYYANPALWSQLFWGIQQYNFDDYEAFVEHVSELLPKIELDAVSQSTNTGQKYLFSPAFIKSDIESILRWSKVVNATLFVKEEIIYQRYSEREDDGMSSLFTYDIWRQWQLVEDCIRRRRDKLFILGYPHSLHQLTANEGFLSRNQDCVHGFVNLDGPAFVGTRLLKKYGYSFNDQMINWKTGLNFFHCQFGRRHFLPIFAKTDVYRNLLNLHYETMPIDDEFKITSEFKKCECGKYYCDFKFVPHVANFLEGYDYDELLSLRDRLTSTFRWIQFVQFDKTRDVTVLYETSNGLTYEDIDLINEVIPNVSFQKDRYWKVGAKYPCFWRL